MEAPRFDQLTRSLAKGLSRRGLLRGVTGAMAGTVLSVQVSGRGIEAARGGPDACAVYCAGEPGARGAQCRKACKQCGDDPDTFCISYVNEVIVYSCCPDGEQCYRGDFGPAIAAIDPVQTMPGVCCASPERACRDPETWDLMVCCPEGTTCTGSMCCPPETTPCYDLSADRFICGIPDENGQCL